MDISEWVFMAWVLNRWTFTVSIILLHVPVLGNINQKSLEYYEFIGKRLRIELDGGSHMWKMYKL